MLTQYCVNHYTVGGCCRIINDLLKTLSDHKLDISSQEVAIVYGHFAIPSNKFDSHWKYICTLPTWEAI